MSTRYKFVVPTTDNGANQKFIQFRTGFVANATTLGYDLTDIDAVNAVTAAFTNDLAARDLLASQLRQAVNVKNASLEAANNTVRTYVNRVVSNPAATPAILASMGIVPITNTAGPVQTPSQLSAAPNANGTCVLRWNANGNTNRTTYVIEASSGGGGWTWIGNTTRRRWVDNFASVGIAKLYRVRAQRRNEVSPPSAEAGIYQEGDSAQLKLAA